MRLFPASRIQIGLLVLGVALCSHVTGAAAPAAATAPRTKPLPFAPGEELKFAVKYGMVRAGDAGLSVEGLEMVDGEPTYRLVSTARSSRFFSTFFEVRDRVESCWSPTRRLPLRFEQHIREGSYKRDISLRFDHEKGVVTDGKGKEHDILTASQDVLSSFYFVRTQNLKPGDIIHVPNHANGKNYALDVRVMRKETVKVPAGRFSCIVVEPLLKSAGLFKQEGRLTIWLTDDARRMPVLMKSKVAVGSIVAELESFRLGKPVPLPPGDGKAASADSGTTENQSP